ncbi:hypothetical protein NC652_034746 [Populus alba x Populus x berolinensis]|nr:hypothetical protein NC652_034746 [Populus alba x Populus x berolinensis]
MAYHLRLDFNLIKGFAIVVEGGAEAGTPVKWCLSPWQRKGGLCKTDHDERRRWFPLRSHLLSSSKDEGGDV